MGATEASHDSTVIGPEKVRPLKRRLLPPAIASA